MAQTANKRAFQRTWFQAKTRKTDGVVFGQNLHMLSPGLGSGEATANNVGEAPRNARQWGSMTSPRNFAANAEEMATREETECLWKGSPGNF